MTDPAISKKSFEQCVQDLREQAQKLLKRHSWLRLFVQVVFVLGGALMIGLLGIYVANSGTPISAPDESTTAAIDDAAKREAARNLWRVAAFCFQGFGLLLVFVGQAFLFFVDRGASDIVSEATSTAEQAKAAADVERDRAIQARTDAQAAVEALKAETEIKAIKVGEDIQAFGRSLNQAEASLNAKEYHNRQISTLYVIVRQMLEALEVVIANGGAKRVDTCRFMIDCIMSHKHLLLGLNDEYLAVTVYVPEAKPDGQPAQLACLTTRRPTSADENQPHRKWEIGRGIAGIAFEAGTEQARTLRSAKDLEQLRVLDSDRRDFDLKQNRCIAAIPIRFKDEKSGVLTMACATEEFFSLPVGDAQAVKTARLDPMEPFRALAAILAIVLSYPDTNV